MAAAAAIVAGAAHADAIAVEDGEHCLEMVALRGGGGGVEGWEG